MQLRTRLAAEIERSRSFHKQHPQQGGGAYDGLRDDELGVAADFEFEVWARGPRAGGKPGMGEAPATVGADCGMDASGVLMSMPTRPATKRV